MALQVVQVVLLKLYFPAELLPTLVEGVQQHRHSLYPKKIMALVKNAIGYSKIIFQLKISKVQTVIDT